MESKRPVQRVSPSPAADNAGWEELLRRWGNTVLTVLLVVVAAFLFVRWRTVHAAQARISILSQLASAESLVQALGNENPSRPVRSIADSRLNSFAQASSTLSEVLNGTDDPSIKAQALITRGDLFWRQANLPELPGAATQPSLRVPTPVDQSLQRAGQTYQEVLDAYAGQHDAAVAAHFGLAAIAENQSDWPAATKQLQAVLNDPAVGTPLHDQAQRELTLLPSLEQKLYFSTTQPLAAPATQASTGAPSFGPLAIQGPAAPSALQHTPASTAVAQPASLPSVGVSPAPVVLPTSLPTSLPATGPAAPAVVQPASHPATTTSP